MLKKIRVFLGGKWYGVSTDLLGRHWLEELEVKNKNFIVKSMEFIKVYDKPLRRKEIEKIFKKKKWWQEIKEE